MVDITTGNKDTIDADDDGQYPFFVRSPQVLRINSYEHDGEAIFFQGKGILEKYFIIYLMANLIFTNVFIVSIILEKFMENISGIICKQPS